MGFYLRSSVKAGPFRFNVSSRGLGASVGVPGFRIGTGPRGNYAQVGAHGLYYRTSFGGGGSSGRGHSSPGNPVPAAPGFFPPPSSDVVMHDVTGATAMSLQPNASGDIVEQLNAAASRHRVGMWAAIVCFLVGLALLPYGLAVWLVALPVCWWLIQRDRARRTVPVIYDVTDHPAQWFDALVNSWSALTNSQKIWRVIQSGAVETVYQHKVNSGASHILSRQDVAAALEGPKHLSTNVAVPSLSHGTSGIFFLPDRVLVRERNHYTDISYQQLDVDVRSTDFIESGGAVPRDAQQVGQTWQYVNVKGGPDRRFKNNRILPVMRYGQLTFSTASGLRWQLQVSRSDAPISAARIVASPPPILK